MLEQIFIVGYGGSGTRVISQILERVGYHTGQFKNINDAYDFMPLLPLVEDYIFKNKGNDDWIRDVVKRDSRGKPWAYKHGQLMMMLPYMKKLFPEAKIIMIVRHGLDNILNHFEWHKTYEKKYIKLPELEAKAKTWAYIHEKALPDVDYIIRLEDLCENPEIEVYKLLKFVGSPVAPAVCCDIVKKPESIGLRNRFVDWIEYSPGKKDELYPMIKDTLNKFGYET